MSVFDPREGVDKVWPGNGVIYLQRLSALRTKSRLSKIMASPLYKSMTVRSWSTTIKLLDILKDIDVSNEIHEFFLETLERCLPAFGDTILFCHAQNLRGTWRWLNNEHFTRTLPRELAHHARLRIVRLRTGEHEIPEWYAQSEKDLYGSSQGIFTIGDSGHIFASVQEKPPSAMNLSKELSKVLPRTRADKKTQTAKVYQPRPDVAAWNAGIGEMTVACANPGDAFLCAVMANELRHHFASHFGSPTILPLPLHLASLLQEYVLPLTKPARISASEALEEDE